MARSALYSIKNATLQLDVAASSGGVDPETGNFVSASDSLSIDLYLEESSLNDEQVKPGSNYNESEYAGNMVNPKIPDGRVKAGLWGTLLKDGKSYRCKIKEVGAPFGVTGLIGQVLANSIGTPIVVEVEKP